MNIVGDEDYIWRKNKLHKKPLSNYKGDNGS